MLTLSKETVRVLTDRALGTVGGGFPAGPFITEGWSCAGECEGSGFLSCKDPTLFGA